MKGFLKSKKTRIVLIILIVVVVLVALIARACSSFSDTMSQMTNMKEIKAVEVRDLSESISESGTVSGIQKNNVSSTAAAKVTAVNVSVGDTVAAGDVLCTMDSADIEADIAATQKNISNANAVSANTKSQEQAALTQAQEDYNSANTQLANDKNTLASLQNQLAATSSNDLNYEKLEAEVESMKQTVSADESSVTSLKRALDSAQNTVDMQAYESSDTTSTLNDTLKTLQEQLADCVMTAPISGLVTAVNVSVGDTNTPNAVIFTIEDTSSLVIKVSVDESDILKVEEGMKATVTASALDDEKLSGTVTRVIKVKDQSSSSAASDYATSSSSSGYSAEITLDSNSKLLVGMTAKVKIIINQREESLAVPYDLIQTDEDGNQFVLLAEPVTGEEDASSDLTTQYTAVRCDVEAGDEIDYYTEITGGDLKEGDLLIVDYDTAEGDIFYGYESEGDDVTSGGVTLY